MNNIRTPLPAARQIFSRSIVLLFLFFNGFVSGFAQPLTNTWNKMVSIKPYNTFDLGDKIALIGTDTNGVSTLSLLTEGGDNLQIIGLPQVEVFGSSLYDSTHQCFYVVGANEDVTIMRLLKIRLDGSVVWQQNRPFSGYRFPYSIAQQGNQLAFTFGQLNITGESTGIGWWLLDTLGNVLGEKTHALPVSAQPTLPFVSAFDSSTGHLIMTASNLVDGSCSVFSFDPVSGANFWETPFTLPIESTIEGLLVDSNGHIFITGESGFLIKMDAAGQVLFNQDLGYDSISLGYKILEHNGDLYVLGGWRESFTFPNTTGKMLVGKYNKSDGKPDWVWIYEHTGISNGPIASDGFFKNDSTLIIQFSRLFESDWLGEFHLDQTTPAHEPTTLLPLQFFPNPTNDGSFRLEGIHENGGNVRVYTATGRLLFAQEYVPSEQVLLSGPGVFFVEYTRGNRHWAGKIISEQ